MLKKYESSTIISVVLVLLSGAFSVGIYASNTLVIGKRLDKVEKDSTNNSELLCLLALEVVKDDKETVKKLCIKGDN